MVRVLQHCGVVDSIEPDFKSVSFVTLGKSPNLSVPQLPHLSTGNVALGLQPLCFGKTTLKEADMECNGHESQFLPQGI